MSEWVQVPVEPTEEMIIAASAGEVHTADVESAIRRRVLTIRRYKAMLAAAPPEPDEVRRLEREIAENWAGMYINGAHECYYADGWLDIDRYCHKGVARDFMRKAARYLELRGLLERHPDNPNLVRIKEGGHD